MHFGLRQGGTLLLGTSETVTDAEELFEPLDKKNRIYRRIGSMRQGSMDFPLSGSSAFALHELGERPRLRASVASMANKALLDLYSPPSVVIDRDNHILYFHGNTERFLDQPRGEPTRDILELTRESIRGILRMALQQAISKNHVVRVSDGWVRATDSRRRRTTITVTPLERRENQPYFLIAFGDDYETEVAGNALDGSDGRGQHEMMDELARVREELENTIHELHGSNEDLKAAHEEATSINEEMQSTNEELETSKEELQSLNEELVTVNTQLQLKMEELETARTI